MSISPAAIHGYCFCKAAQQAFGIMARNALRVAAINKIGDFVLFLGKAAVTISTVFIGLEIMKVSKLLHRLMFVLIHT